MDIRERTALARILVVEADQSRVSEYRSWLEQAGFEVATCPGPCAPQYLCSGVAGPGCVLAETADAIVLDLWLESDTLLQGPPGWEILLYYMGLRKPVVVITGGLDPVRPVPDDQTVVLLRPPDRATLVRAVRRVLADQPLTTPIGRSRATRLASPARSQVATTSSTFL